MISGHVTQKWSELSPHFWVAWHRSICPLITGPTIFTLRTIIQHNGLHDHLRPFSLFPGTRICYLTRPGISHQWYILQACRQFGCSLEGAETKWARDQKNLMRKIQQWNFHIFHSGTFHHWNRWKCKFVARIYTYTLYTYTVNYTLTLLHLRIHEISTKIVVSSEVCTLVKFHPNRFMQHRGSD